MEAAVWMCFDIFYLIRIRRIRFHTLLLFFVPFFIYFFRLDVCVYSSIQCTQIFSNFLSIFFIAIAFIIRFCARCQENAYSHINSTIYVLLINLNTYRFATLVSIVSPILSFLFSHTLMLLIFFSCFFFLSVDIPLFITYMPDCRLLFCIQISHCCSLI